MYKKLKVPPRDPVDVTNLRKLTAEERQAQTCDPRSWMAEVSADPDRPVAVAEDHPNLGGRRLFVQLFNALFKHVQRVRASRLQKPNLKALHLHSAAYHWRRASTLRRLLCGKEEALSNFTAEEIGMDFMQAAIVSVYSAVATIDVFSQEVMFDKLKAEAGYVGRPADLVETLKECLPKLTGKRGPTGMTWWEPFRNVVRARNSVTHTGATNPEKEEEFAKAWEALLAPEIDPPDVARCVILHFSNDEPGWVERVIDRGRTMADAEETTAMIRNNMRPVHPGEVLRGELDALRMSAKAFAEALDVSSGRIAAILNGRRGVTADTALRLARYLGTTAEFWMNLQKTFELRVAETKAGKRIADRVKPRRAA